MRHSGVGRRGFLVGAGLLLLLAGGAWLGLGRLPLFQTSSYISDFAIRPENLYRVNVLWLTEGAEVKQDFVSEYPGLYKITVLLTGPESSLSPGFTPGNENKANLRDTPQPAALFSGEQLGQQVVLNFHLRENCEAATDLRQTSATISAADLGDGLFYPFTFAPLDESTGRKFCFMLTPVWGAAEQGAIGVRASGSDVYEAGRAFYRTLPAAKPAAAGSEAGQPDQPTLPYKTFMPIIQRQADRIAAIDLGFQLHYDGHPLETLQVFMSRLTAHKPYFWGSAAFYILLLLSYLGGVFLLMRMALVENRED